MYTLNFLVTGDAGTSWLAHRALPATECLQVTPSVGSSSSWDRPVYSTATFPATVWSQFKLDLKERETTNEIKHEPLQTAAAELLPKESHATANVSLLAGLQKLSTATLIWKPPAADQTQETGETSWLVKKPKHKDDNLPFWGRLCQTFLWPAAVAGQPAETLGSHLLRPRTMVWYIPPWKTASFCLHRLNKGFILAVEFRLPMKVVTFVKFTSAVVVDKNTQARVFTQSRI